MTRYADNSAFGQEVTLGMGLPTREEFVSGLLAGRQQAMARLEAAVADGKRKEALQLARSIRKIDAGLARFGVVAGLPRGAGNTHG